MYSAEFNGEYVYDNSTGEYPKNRKGYILMAGQNKKWQIRSGSATGSLVADTGSAVDVSCPEDLSSSLEFDVFFMDDKGDVDSITFDNFEECPPKPTTTSKPCAPCRKVAAGHGALSGVYTHTASGDGRCTMDGCLYKKDNDVYCFRPGNYAVEETCSP